MKWQTDPPPEHDLYLVTDGESVDVGAWCIRSYWYRGDLEKPVTGWAYLPRMEDGCTLPTIVKEEYDKIMERRKNE